MPEVDKNNFCQIIILEYNDSGGNIMVTEKMWYFYNFDKSVKYADLIQYLGISVYK